MQDSILTSGNDDSCYINMATYVKCSHVFKQEEKHHKNISRLKHLVLKTKEPEALPYHQHLYDCLNTLFIHIKKIEIAKMMPQRTRECWHLFQTGMKVQWRRRQSYAPESQAGYTYCEECKYEQEIIRRKWLNQLLNAFGRLQEKNQLASYGQHKVLKAKGRQASSERIWSVFPKTKEAR